MINQNKIKLSILNLKAFRRDKLNIFDEPYCSGNCLKDHPYCSINIKKKE